MRRRRSPRRRPRPHPTQSVPPARVKGWRPSRADLLQEAARAAAQRDRGPNDARDDVSGAAAVEDDA